MPGILGIDPGVSGAAALYNPTASVASGFRWVVIDLPRGDGVLDARLFRDWLRKYEPTEAWIERVTPNPKFGAIGISRLLGSYYALTATLACCDVPIHPVTSPTWKHSLGLSRDKEADRALALKMFPEMSDWLKRKGDHNRADSILIAAYGASKLGLFA